MVRFIFMYEENHNLDSVRDPADQPAQTDVLILQKNGHNIKTYTPGMQIMLHTVYDQWFEGTLTI
jgi:hypothetical protein